MFDRIASDLKVRDNFYYFFGKFISRWVTHFFPIAKSLGCHFTDVQKWCKKKRKNLKTEEIKKRRFDCDLSSFVFFRIEQNKS